jgi:hypothetical protein
VMEDLTTLTSRCLAKCFPSGSADRADRRHSDNWAVVGKGKQTPSRRLPCDYQVDHWNHALHPWPPSYLVSLSGSRCVPFRTSEEANAQAGLKRQAFARHIVCKEGSVLLITIEGRARGDVGRGQMTRETSFPVLRPAVYSDETQPGPGCHQCRQWSGRIISSIRE